MSRDDFLALAARIEASAGADMEIDLALWDAFYPEEAFRGVHLEPSPLKSEKWAAVDGGKGMWHLTPFTADLNACLALQGRLGAPERAGITGWRAHLEKHARGWLATLERTDGRTMQFADGAGRDLPRAWLAAMCRAKAEPLP